MASVSNSTGVFTGINELHVVAGGFASGFTLASGATLVEVPVAEDSGFSYTGGTPSVERYRIHGLSTPWAAKMTPGDAETNLFIPGTQEGMNIELDKAFRLRDFITMGELIAYDALNRHESCGGHFREEHQTEEGEAKRDDENFFYVACWKYNGNDETAPTLIKEPLHYEAIKVQTRNYKS